ncbi:hypothetical protein CC80DRAFT_592578 [Byssothecium circinans]|uniref:NWD NACHT-NTPase N-terminal domain-containing protein n=1 Tax=Byssothecium circinans TaxID=147558 RepID=A0A6A5TYZ6_9PLEO|nr:hypothetical protein CC80DRAFT_592578 [Byssothecium circinans]
MSELSEKASRRSKLKSFFTIRGSKGKQPSTGPSDPPQTPRPTPAISTPEHVNHDEDTKDLRNVEGSSQQHVHEKPVSEMVPADQDAMFVAARKELWRKAFQRLSDEEPDLAASYEELLRADAGVENEATFSPEVTDAIVTKQRSRMQSKQWTFSWFGKHQKFRDTAESVLTTINKVSGFVSIGMSAAPPFVSLPWSMATCLVAFVMSDFDAVNSAIEGLNEVTMVLANYSLAEKEFLLDPATKSGYEKTVISLYTAIFEYQARAAQYFASNTLERFGTNTITAPTWPDAITTVRTLERSCHVPIQTLAVSLNKKQFNNVDDLLNQGMKLMEQISRSVASDRAQRERLLKWISPISHLQDHADLRNQIGDAYLSSGQWLLQDESDFVPWKQSWQQSSRLDNLT